MMLSDACEGRTAAVTGNRGRINIMKRYVMGMTGASGAVYGVTVLRELLRQGEVHLVASMNALTVLKEETGIDWSSQDEAETQRRINDYFSSGQVKYWAERRMDAPISSGSFPVDGMLVVPCSMKTLAGIASGYADTLVQRVADVTIKEGRPLLLAPREMPFSAIHLENMLKLARLGVKIAPPVPGFYHRPESLEAVINFVAGKILDAMGIEHELFKRWGVEQ